MTTRRKLIQGLAGASLLGSLPLVPGSLRQAMAGLAANSTHITLSGQLLMEHALCSDPYEGFADVVAELRRGDVVCSDLEVAIRTAASGAPTREGDFLHVTEPAVLDCVSAMGFNLLSLANNHAWDLGTAGVMATRAAVAEAGLGHAGTGPDLAGATAVGNPAGWPDIVLLGVAIGKLREGAAATSTRAGVNELRMPTPGKLHADDVARNLAVIRSASAAGKQVIVCLHNHEWGEDMAVLGQWLRQFAHDCIDAGARIFFSHGAPLLLGMEIYRGSPVLYGLGSLVFHSRTPIGHYRAEVWETAIVHLAFENNELQRMEVVPVILNETGDDPDRHLLTRGRPRLAQDEDANRILQRLQQLSQALGMNLTLRDGRAWWN